MTRTIKAGEELVYRVTRPGVKAEIVKAAAPCEIKDQGHWYCDTHEKHFPNNFEKDSHITGRCRLVWICWHHGPEQP